MTTLTHTSPVIIESINMFGGCASNGTMFFSIDGYAMGYVAATYELELDDAQIIHTSDLECADTMNEIAELFECDEDDAYELMTAGVSEWDFECDAEKSWKLQGLRAQAAKNMGFVACEDEDENGTVYMIVMNNELLAEMKLI